MPSAASVHPTPRTSTTRVQRPGYARGVLVAGSSHCDEGARENLGQGGLHLDDIPGELEGAGGVFSPGNRPGGRDVRLVRGFAYQGVQSFRPEVFPEQVHQ